MMLFKAVGCILIIFSSTAIGINHINNLRDRALALFESSEFVNILKIKMGYELCDIPSIFKSLEDKYFIAKNCLIHIKNGDSLKIAWNKSIDKYAKKAHLNSSDISILKDFCVCLGQTDIEGQISNLNMYLKLLEKRINEAKSELSDKSKVIFSTSIFSGLLISIILI